MWNLELLIPEDERFTRIYRCQRELIDHILVSHALTDSIDSVTTGEWASPQWPTRQVGVMLLRPRTIDH